MSINYTKIDTLVARTIRSADYAGAVADAMSDLNSSEASCYLAELDKAEKDAAKQNAVQTTGETSCK